jgi:hypothetical protein
MKMYYRVPTNFGEPAVAPYSPPFPNLRAKSWNDYQAAMRAQEAVDKLKWFKDIYNQLALATSSAHLALNSADRVIVIPEEKSTENLLGPKLVQAALKQAGKSLAKQLVGEDFGRVLGILDLLLKLSIALGLADEKRLVSEQNGSRRDDAYRYKLHFFVQLWIAQNAPQADRVILASRMTDTFFKYRKALGELWKYQNMEQNLKEGLPPTQRRPQIMYAR